MKDIIQHSRRRFSSMVRIDLRGLPAHYRALYAEPERLVTYTVEVVRKRRKKTSSKKGGESMGYR